VTYNIIRPVKEDILAQNLLRFISGDIQYISIVFFSSILILFNGVFHPKLLPRTHTYTLNLRVYSFYTPVFSVLIWTKALIKFKQALSYLLQFICKWVCVCAWSEECG